MRVTYLGVGEAFDSELANTSLLVETEKANILLDCGYGIPYEFWKKVKDPDYLDIIYLTHQHADHTFGFPSLLIRFLEDERTRPLVLCGHTSMEDLLAKLTETAFPTILRRIRYRLETVAFERELSRCGVKLRIAPMTHSTPNYAVRVEADGKALCYSGDGTPTPSAEALFAGADVLAHEAYLRTEEKFGHGCMGSVKALASKLKLRNVDLVHINRRVRREEKENLAFAKGWARIPEPGETRVL